MLSTSHDLPAAEQEGRALPQEQLAVRRRHLLVLLLALNTGATDAIGFVGLGGVFTSVMTDNMVLLGLSAGTGDGTLAAHIAAAIASFALGCAIGARIAGLPRAADVVWPDAVTLALLVEFAAYLTFFVGWELADGRPDESLQLGLLVVNALALGIQSSAIQRFGVSGLSTTYLTGTLTTVMIRIVTGQRLRDVRTSVEILLALVAGAAAGGSIAVHMPRGAPLFPLACVGSALLLAAWQFARRPAAAAAVNDPSAQSPVD